MITALILVLVYFVIGSLIVIADMYEIFPQGMDFNGDDNPPPVAVLLFWPVLAPAGIFALMLFALIALNKKLEDVKRRVRARKKVRTRKHEQKA